MGLQTIAKWGLAAVCFSWARASRHFEHAKYTLQLHRYLVLHHISIVYMHLTNHYYMRPTTNPNDPDDIKRVNEADLIQVTAKIGDKDYALTLLAKCIVRHLFVEDYTTDVCKTILKVANLPITNVVIDLVYLSQQSDVLEKRVYFP